MNIKLLCAVVMVALFSNTVVCTLQEEHERICHLLSLGHPIKNHLQKRQFDDPQDARCAYTNALTWRDGASREQKIELLKIALKNGVLWAVHAVLNSGICLDDLEGKAFDYVPVVCLRELSRLDGAQIDQQEKQSGDTALHRAVQQYDHERVYRLLLCGADAGIRNISGDRPLDLARQDFASLTRPQGQAVLMMQGMLLAHMRDEMDARLLRKVKDVETQTDPLARVVFVEPHVASSTHDEEWPPLAAARPASQRAARQRR